MVAMLDVSAALQNPYTLDSFSVLRRKQFVNNFGQTKIESERFDGVRGVVYPEGLNDLSRRAEVQTNAKSIVVITKFGLRSESKTVDQCEYQPDVVVWNGSNFLVVRVEDYSKYARGFIKVAATSIDIVDPPAATR